MAKKILLIDDEELVIKSLEKVLRKEGFQVTCAGNGAQAINHIENEDFDLIVTDIRMPGLSGVDLIEQIRSTLKRKNKPLVPEICITGYAEQELSKKAEALAVADFLYKPFDLRDFLNRVNRHLNIQGS